MPWTRLLSVSSLAACNQERLETLLDLSERRVVEEVVEEPELLSALLEQTGRQRLQVVHLLSAQVMARADVQHDLSGELLSVGLAARLVLDLHVEVERALGAVGLPAGAVGTREGLSYLVVAPPKVPLPTRAVPLVLRAQVRLLLLPRSGVLLFFLFVRLIGRGYLIVIRSDEVSRIMEDLESALSGGRRLRAEVELGELIRTADRAAGVL